MGNIHAKLYGIWILVQEEMSLKDVLSRALTVPLFGGAKPFVQMW